MKGSQQPVKPTTGATVPRSGLLTKIDQYVIRVVGSRNYWKYFLQGLIFTTGKSFPTIFGSFLRGKIYRVALGNIGNGGLIEKNVTINVPNRVFLGHRVVLGESTVLDPRGIYGKIIIKDDAHIQRWSRLTTGGHRELPGELVIENSVYIGPFAYIHAAGKVQIGRDCLFGPRITIVGGNHQYEDKEVKIRFQGGIPKDISIEEDVWLSASVTVLGGVTIGKGAVIGAGSVVAHSIPPYGVAVGAPAKVIGTRGETPMSETR